eukprot:3471440-Pleurochrysis_carterae.AAC.1
MISGPCAHVFTQGAVCPATRVHARVCVPAKLSARETGLALALDDGTRKSHSVAENTAFVTGFFKGIATVDSFSRLVASLYYVYEAMEAAFDATEDERVRALDAPELRRVAALEDDMKYYFGDEWRGA